MAGIRGLSPLRLFHQSIQAALEYNKIYICDATETGGMPPVTKTNETTPPPWRRQAALV